jgi:hypothetical protein
VLDAYIIFNDERNAGCPDFQQLTQMTVSLRCGTPSVACSNDRAFYNRQASNTILGADVSCNFGGDVNLDRQRQRLCRTRNLFGAEIRPIAIYRFLPRAGLADNYFLQFQAIVNNITQPAEYSGALADNACMTL